MKKTLFPKPFKKILPGCILFLALTHMAFTATGTFRIQHYLYDEDMRNNWRSEAVRGEVNNQDESIVHNGRYSVSAKLEKDGVLVFTRDVSMNMAGYTGIVGYINGGDKGRQLIGVCVMNHNNQLLPNRTGLDLRRYIQGGVVPVGNWQPFAIPLRDFGPLPRGAKAICFVNASGEALETFYSDELGLVNTPIRSGATTSQQRGSELIRGRPEKVSVVYDDTVKSGWAGNWSWSCTMTPFNSTSAGGKNCLSVVQEPGGALAFGRHRGFDTSDYEYLEFSINGGNALDQRLGVRVWDEDGNEIQDGWVDINNRAYIEGGRVSANQWKHVVIPLRVLKAENISISKIAFINASRSKQTFLIDEIRFFK